MTIISPGKRRPIRSRNSLFAIVTAKWLASHGFRPNHISLLSVVFSAFAALCLFFSSYVENPFHSLMFIGAAFFILLRLLCNLFDGMLAIEGGFYSKAGEIYNDFPDRLSDILILIAAGYVAKAITGSVELGLITAMLATLTAYIRLLGHAAGTKQYFIGPMAKQHRMAVIIIACLLSTALNPGWIFVSALVLIAVGSVITIVRRLKSIVTDLEAG
jgi:phosphatidylglycerophosphate synthase